MNAPRIVSLDHLTVFELTPPQVVRCAAAAGYRHVGLRLKPAAASGEAQHPIVGDTPMRRETLAALRDTGIEVLDWGVLRLKAETVVADFEPWLETAAVLGARHALVNGDEPDDARLTDLFGQLCELGRRYQHHLPLRTHAVDRPEDAGPGGADRARDRPAQRPGDDRHAACRPRRAHGGRHRRGAVGSDRVRATLRWHDAAPDRLRDDDLPRPAASAPFRAKAAST